jgi:multidrug efflux pump subunit AcrA (membrane-fusion protein)
MNKKYKWLIALTLATLVLAGCGAKDETPQAMETPQGPLPVIAEGHLVPRDSMYLAFPVGGHVSEILVEEGEQVGEGQALIRLGDTQQAEAALAAAKLEQNQAQQAFDAFMRTAGLASAQNWQDYLDAQSARAALERQWEALDLDAIQTRIDDAQAEVQDRNADLEDAQTTFDKYKDLDQDNATRKQAEDDLQQAQENYNEAVRKLEAVTRERDGIWAALDLALAAEAEAKRKYETTLDGPDAETQAVLQARLDFANSQVAAAESAVANYELKAPFDGVVTDINVTVNQLVGPDTWAVLVADFSQWYVDTTDLTELEVVKVVEGQAVEIVADALPDVTLNGVVESISQSFKLQGGDILYTVHIRLEIRTRSCAGG